MDLPNPLRELGNMLQTAAKLEFGSPAGKVNSWGMFLAVVLISLGTVTGWIEDLIRVFRPRAVSAPTDFSQLFVIFVILVIVCVILVVLDAKKRGRG